jgi:FAD/FMN-containing dehydrogenase
VLARHDGSISAEHGIGLVKKPWLARMRGEAEMVRLRGIRETFDPDGILNPGKVFD